MKEFDEEVINIIRTFSFLSISEIEDILEYLEDTKCLSAKGKAFRTKFWESFIKE